MKTHLIKSIVIIIILLAGSSNAGGIETRPLTSSKTVSLNSLYLAGSDGIIKSFTNPAGLIYIRETSFELSVLDRLAQSEFDNPSRGMFKSLKEDEFNLNGGFLWSASEKIKAAISYQQVMDYNVSWPYANYYQQDSLSALFVFDFFNKIKVEAISASIAYRINNLIIGISPVAYRVTSKVAFPQNNPLWTSGTGTAAYQFEYDQEAWAFGANLGIIAELTSELRMAISARSSYSADLDGEAKSRMFFVTDSAEEVSSVKSVFEMPWILGLGAVYSFSSGLNLNLDFQYSLWSSTLKSVDHDFSNTVWQSKFSETDPGSGINGGKFISNYNNSIEVGVGLEYISQNNISYRVGYLYSQTPNSDITYNMLFPSVDRHTLSVGAGLSEGNLLLDAAILYSFGIKKEINNNLLPNLNGSYDYDLIIPMVTLKYLFF